MTKVSYDQRAITMDGKRTLLLSGAVHYTRSTPGMWPKLMRRSREAGLNTVETYVFWNLHERRRGVFDFSDRLDLRRFCGLAAEAGLHVILRIGPYICAETNYGGFPAWLRDVPGIRFRTYNQPFLREMERWVRTLTDHMRSFFAPRGGPIILAQIENEYGLLMKDYGEAGERYARWAVDLGLSLDVGVPWVMCLGGAPGAIETLNGYHAHLQVEDHFTRHPDQPALWTENWPGWYGTWGSVRRSRPVADVAWGVARFLAIGGTCVNYYMWHGGTNFGRESMFLATTSYDFDAPLDEFGLPTTKSKCLKRLHRLLSDHSDVLLKGDRPVPRKPGEAQSVSAFGTGDRSLVFLCNDDAEVQAAMEWEGRMHTVPPRSVTILAGGEAALNTAEVPRSCVVRRRMKPAGVRPGPFVRWAEPMPGRRPMDIAPCTVAKKPVEQLLLTHDESDYCWYTTQLTVPRAAAGVAELRLERAADIVHVFVDGRFAATSPVPPENRKPGPQGEHPLAQSFTLRLKPGRHTLSLLCCALGLIKGDWSLGRNMAEEKKGLWGGVSWRGRALKGAWTMEPGLVGEYARLFAEGAAAVRWRRLDRRARPRPLTWYRTTFNRPKTAAPLALDLAGMNKGLAWLNGRCIGRYWLTPGVSLPKDWQPECLVTVSVGEPTQRYYHLPHDWLAQRNVLVLFEEVGGNPATIRICERR